MNVRLACVVLVAVGCGTPVEEQADSLEQSLTASQAQLFRALLGSQLEAARARCLLGHVRVGAVSQTQAPRSADSTLSLSATNDAATWASGGCGPAVTVSREPNAFSTSLRAELDGVAGDGAGVAQLAAGLYQQASGDRPVVEFTSAAGRQTNVELPFDGYERAQVTTKLVRLALGDAARQLASVQAADLASLTPAQRRIAFLELAGLVRLVSETAQLAEATSALMVAGPGHYARTPATCTALFLDFRCVDAAWVDAQP